MRFSTQNILMKNLNDFLLTLRANGYIVAVYRIIIGFLVFKYALNYTAYIPLLWYKAPFINLIRVAALFWPLAALLICVGFKTRWVAAVNYLFVLLLIDFCPYYYNVENIFLGMATFWLLFLDSGKFLSVDAFLRRRSAAADGVESRWIPGWPVYLLGLCLSIQFFTSGFNKALDPLWHDGYGFYYTLLLPWLTPDYVRPLLSFEAGLVAMNHIGTVLEIGILFLYIIPGLRFLASLALLSLAVMFAALFTGLGYIGSFLLAMAILLLSLDGPGAPRILRGTDNGSPASSRFIPANPVLKSLPVVIGAFIGIHFLANITPSLIRSRFPLLYGAMAMTGSDAVSRDLIDPDSNALQKLCHKVDAATTRARWLSLFNAHHIMGTYALKVIVHYKDGRAEEPVVIFTEDGRKGSNIPLWMALQSREVGKLMKSMSGAVSVTRRDIWRLCSLIHYAESLLDTPEPSDVDRISIWVSLLPMPETYQGDYSADMTETWDEFFAYRPDTRTYAFYKAQSLSGVSIRLNKSPNRLYFRPGTAGKPSAHIPLNPGSAPE